MQMMMEQRESLQQKDLYIRDLEDYIDDLLVKVRLLLKSILLDYNLLSVQLLGQELSTLILLFQTSWSYQEFLTEGNQTNWGMGTRWWKYGHWIEIVRLKLDHLLSQLSFRLRQEDY